jgi:hypothetical protein
MANTAFVPRTLLFILLLLLLAPACGKDIGDSCSNNVDCDQSGSRDCDQSQPGGYCTINGCDEKSCPGGSVCIRIFPYNYPGPSCSDDSNCSSDHLCLPDGLCVPRASERRFCEKKCDGNGDCRKEYFCLEAGIEGKAPTMSTYGSIALVAHPELSKPVGFCAPKQ